MSTPKDQIADIGTLILCDTSTLSGGVIWDSLEALQEDAAILIVQNDSTTTVNLSTNGTSTKSIPFTTGTKLVLDLRANHGVSDNTFFRAGTVFKVNGVAGTGDFTISVIYTR